MHTMCSQAPAVFELLPDPNSKASVWPFDRAPPKATIIRSKDGPKSAENGVERASRSSLDFSVMAGPDGWEDGDDGIVREEYEMEDFRKLLGATLEGFTVRRCSIIVAFGGM
jgi:hypothetical protein